MGKVEKVVDLSRRSGVRAMLRRLERELGGEVDVGELSGENIADLAGRLLDFLEPYRCLLGWKSREAHLNAFVQGLVGSVERKSVEPVAVSQGYDARLLQHFVGVSQWDGAPLLRNLRTEVAAEIGEDDGVLVIDGSAVPKKGVESVGVKRQWCGRLGKVENCQLGVYLAYAGKGFCTIVDRRLYLPKEWAEHNARRAKVHVPDETKFKTPWELADQMLLQDRAELPHRWIVGDDEFGRPSRFRDRLSARGERYLLEVPSNIVVRRVRGRFGRRPTWHNVVDFVKRLPVKAWSYFKVRDGEKGPVEVRAACSRVETKRRRGGAKRETLLVMETLDGSQRWLFLSNASQKTSIATLVSVAAKRHLIEEALQVGKGEVGLDHYEVRTWQGWHHHTACALIAQWFLVREQRRLGKKSTASHRGARTLHGERTPPAADGARRHREPGHVPTISERGRPCRPLPSEAA